MANTNREGSSPFVKKKISLRPSRLRGEEKETA
jgi:hypothetical protein